MHIPLDRASKTPLTKQIYFYIKQKILRGELNAQYKLPSTRALAKELCVSRNVVLNAYGQLFAEGYIYSKDRSGIFVNPGIMAAPAKAAITDGNDGKIGLQFESNSDVIDFRTGVPNLALFPKNRWGRIYRQVCMDASAQSLDYYEPGGSFELRLRLSKYLGRVRGVAASPDDIIITSGAAQSFSLLAQFFARSGKPVVTEDPISYGIVKILRFFDMDIYPVPVDTGGIKTALLPQNINPSLIFTTPSHQFPTGAVLPISRRIALIEYAKKRGAYIVEDDYDSEFRYEGYPIQSMQSLAPENIIYVGTFSKTLCPALRIGYMILPRHLVESIKSTKYIDDLHSPVLEQMTLAKFIEQGLLDRHIIISKKHYAHKCAYLVRLIKETFGERAEIYGHTAGIHLMVRFKDFDFSEAFISDLRNRGLNINTAEEHAIIKGLYKNHALIGFGNLENNEIASGIKILKETMANYIH